MWAAAATDIRVFATGGIGGVHRGAEETFDISADLTELSETPVTVVCAGIKSILDIGKTLEVMETKGIGCIVYGKENVFPGFFTSTTPFKGQLATEDIDEIALIIEKGSEIGMRSGTVVAVPISKDHHTEGRVIEEALQRAIKEAKKEKVSGQSITPFLLSSLAEKTGGSSLRTNIALLKANAYVAARLAISLEGLQEKQGGKDETYSSPVKSSSFVEKTQQKKLPRVVCVGATIIDIEASSDCDLKEDGGTYPGRLCIRAGGVGRNHAEALARSACQTYLLSALGGDAAAHRGALEAGQPPLMDTSRVLHSADVPSGFYLSINQRGDVRYGLSAIDESLTKITPNYLRRNEDVISSADFIVMDANISAPTLSELLLIAERNHKKVWFDPTDQSKATKWLDATNFSAVTAISPNAKEFIQILRRFGVDIPAAAFSSPASLESFLLPLLPSLTPLCSLSLLLITLAEKGSLLISDPGSVTPRFLQLRPVKPRTLVSVSGAGDTLNSVLLSCLLHGCELETAANFAVEAAARTLAVTHAVAPNISETLPDIIRNLLPTN